METAVKHRVSGAYRTVRAVVWKDGGEISPPPIRSELQHQRDSYWYPDPRLFNFAYQ